MKKRRRKERKERNEKQEERGKRNNERKKREKGYLPISSTWMAKPGCPHPTGFKNLDWKKALANATGIHSHT